MPITHAQDRRPDIAEPARLMADRARSVMLLALAEGEQLSSMDLAARAGISPQTASGHLAKLMRGDLVVATRVGRVRYYHLAGKDVANALRALAAVAGRVVPDLRTRNEDSRSARTCYDHLAGRLGVGLLDALLRNRVIAKRHTGYALTVRGAPVLRVFGLDLPAIRARYRAYARPCLDRTERRPHLGGALGAAIASRAFQLGWIERVNGSRVVRVTPTGRRGMREAFGVEL